MNKRYNHIEIIENIETEYPNLNISTSTNPKLKIFRVLSGTCNCSDDFLNKTFKFRKDYFRLPFHSIREPINKEILLSNFEEIDLDDLNKYFSNIHNHNFEFFTKVEGECVKCLISHLRKAETEAFVHLYRIIECISYSFPLIYAAKAKEFLHTYDLLKKIMTQSGRDNSESELRFFKRFCSEVYKNEDFFQTTFDIKFDSIEDEEERIKLYRLLETITKDNHITTSDSTENEEISFSFSDFHVLLITLRNRYFHLSQGGWTNNISCLDTEYPELLFKLIINKGINWVAILIFEILKFDIVHDPIYVKRRK